MYPNLTITFQISKETKKATVLEICDEDKKYDIENFFVNYGATEENAIYLCHEYFGLPTYEEMLQKIKNNEI